MINLYVKEVDGVWFGVAYEEEKVFATAFAPTENRVLRSLLHGIPFNVPFQQLEKSSSFAERVINSIKAIYDGKDVCNRFSLATEYLTDYARKVIETVVLIPVAVSYTHLTLPTKA